MTQAIHSPYTPATIYTFSKAQLVEHNRAVRLLKERVVSLTHAANRLSAEYAQSGCSDAVVCNTRLEALALEALTPKIDALFITTGPTAEVLYG